MKKIDKPDLTKRIIPNKFKLPSMELAPIKMKDKPGRDRIVIDTMKVFGFLPETIVIDKVEGSSNTIKISAVIPEKPDGKNT